MLQEQIINEYKEKLGTLINENGELSSIDDAHKTAIISASANLFKSQVNSSIGSVVSRIEEDILGSTGIEKKSGEKYFEYLKRAGSELKENLSTASGSSAELTAQIEELKKQVKGGKVDEAMKTELAAKEQKLLDLTTQIDELKTTNATIVENHQKEIAAQSESILLNDLETKWSKVAAGLKPKDGLTQEDFNEILESKKQILIAKYKREYEETDKGKAIRFRGEDGKILTNDKDLSNPHTYESLLLNEVGRFTAEEKPGGSGTGQQGRKQVISIGAAKTRDEAVKNYKQELAQSGLSQQKDATAYQEKMNAFRTSDDYKSLPYAEAETVI